MIFCAKNIYYFRISKRCSWCYHGSFVIRLEWNEHVTRVSINISLSVWVRDALRRVWWSLDVHKQIEGERKRKRIWRKTNILPPSLFLWHLADASIYLITFRWRRLRETVRHHRRLPLPRALVPWRDPHGATTVPEPWSTAPGSSPPRRPLGRNKVSSVFHINANLSILIDAIKLTI